MGILAAATGGRGNTKPLPPSIPILQSPIPKLESPFFLEYKDLCQASTPTRFARDRICVFIPIPQQGAKPPAPPGSPRQARTRTLVVALRAPSLGSLRSPVAGAIFFS